MRMLMLAYRLSELDLFACVSIGLDFVLWVMDVEMNIIPWGLLAC